MFPEHPVYNADFLAPDTETVGSSRPLERAGKIVSAAFAPRRERRVAFWKKRAFPLLPALEIPAREDAGISLFAVISRATRTANADAGIREREETGREREELIWMPGDERGETCARVCVYGSVGVRGYKRTAREWKGERAKAREKNRGEGGVERERGVRREGRRGGRGGTGRESERQGQKERGSVIPPPRGVKTTPRARGVSGLGAEANRARPKRAQCPTHTRSRTAHD